MPAQQAGLTQALDNKMKSIDALEKDYESTLAFIDKCDDHMFKIKNWALITTSAVIAFSISRDKHLIVLVNLVLILAFIYLELIYKSFQDTAIDHTNRSGRTYR